MTASAISGQFEAAYETKAPVYFTGARQDFVNRLPEDENARILEIGCGSGETGSLALAGGRAGYYAGVELMQEPAAKAAGALSEVVIGNIEAIDIPWQPASFDALILSEVLEHLVDPRAVLKRLAPLVRPGGRVLASSPNISHWRVLQQLLGGHFPATDKGVFDRTHLRWFTPETFVEMFEVAGFQVKYCGPVTPFSKRVELLSHATGGRLDHLFMTQIAIDGVRR
ncbi:MAG: class I SAM-dependent methyltransferase [Hyphomicrobiaceae bacterium]